MLRRHTVSAAVAIAIAAICSAPKTAWGDPDLTGARQGDGTGPPSHWLEWGKAFRQASLIVEPADGRLPPATPEAQHRAAATITR